MEKANPRSAGFGKGRETRHCGEYHHTASSSHADNISCVNHLTCWLLRPEDFTILLGLLRVCDPIS